MGQYGIHKAVGPAFRRYCMSTWPNASYSYVQFQIGVYRNYKHCQVQHYCDSLGPSEHTDSFSQRWNSHSDVMPMHPLANVVVSTVSYTRSELYAAC